MLLIWWVIEGKHRATARAASSPHRVKCAARIADEADVHPSASVPRGENSRQTLESPTFSLACYRGALKRHDGPLDRDQKEPHE